MSDAEPNNPTSNGRHPDGKFAQGHRFAKGNPVHRRMAALRAALLDSTTAADVQAVGAKLAELAKAGDVQAAKVWFDSVIGRPVQAVELTSDGEPLGLDWQRVQAVLLDALAPFEEARVAVALRLRGLADEARGGGDADDAR